MTCVHSTHRPLWMHCWGPEWRPGLCPSVENRIGSVQGDNADECADSNQRTNLYPSLG
jgi:hypothetical protein